jgi:hypothetical protein
MGDRDLRYLVNTVHDLTVRGIGFKVLTGRGASIDTTFPGGKLVLSRVHGPATPAAAGFIVRLGEE